MFLCFLVFKSIHTIYLLFHPTLFCFVLLIQAVCRVILEEKFTRNVEDFVRKRVQQVEAGRPNITWEMKDRRLYAAEKWRQLCVCARVCDSPR